MPLEINLARPNFALRTVLRAASSLWRKGGEIKRRRDLCQAESRSPLPVPVVSIGGITIGGSGKTPFTNHLAAALQALGYSPAILTRGYRRQSSAKTLILPPGTEIASTFTGDEAQIFLLSGHATIGIGADRYETAKVLLHHHPSTKILLLDDGFQHACLNRDLDIVLIDGLDPFGGGQVFPLGRLREPLPALARAGAFVVTRAELDINYEYICSRIAEYNSSAPVFRACTVTRHWCDFRGQMHDLPLAHRRVAAFCGIGNPRNFWLTLNSLGVAVVFRWEFSDHHRYKSWELQRIAHQARVHGAEILVTTRKDFMNCPDHLEEVLDGLNLAWLDIDFEIDREQDLLNLVRSIAEMFTSSRHAKA